MAAKVASSSQSYVLYLVSISVNFLEKKPIGFSVLFSSCSSAAPIALVDTSVTSTKGAFGDGNAVSVMADNAFLQLSNALVASSV